MAGTYLHCLHLQLERCVFINHDHGVRVQLETRQRPHVVDAAFYALLQREGLVGAGDDGDDFARFEHL